MGSFHAHTLAALAGVEVVAVADPYEPNRARVADALGCEAIAEPIILACRDDLDGVVIASPDDTHPELAVAALEAGAFVLCEKPLASTAAAARCVVDAEVAFGQRRIQMGFMREYDPAHRQLAQAIAAIVLGTLLGSLTHGVLSARGPAFGSKMGIDGTRKLREEGFDRDWPEVIRMDDAVREKIDRLWPGLGL